jgi:hypothetical protein
MSVAGVGGFSSLLAEIKTHSILLCPYRDNFKHCKMTIGIKKAPQIAGPFTLDL